MDLHLRSATRPLEHVSAYCEHFSRALGVSVADSQPLVGKNAFRTATGVHAAAIAKAEHKSQWLSEHVYSLLPAASVGQQASIDIGPMSGASNVQHWLAVHGINSTVGLERAILELAKSADRVLADDELLSVVSRMRREM